MVLGRVKSLLRIDAMKSGRNRAARWGSGIQRSSRSRAIRVVVEECEARHLLSGPTLSLPVAAAELGAPPASRLASYRVFEGAIVRGPHAGLTLEGPLVLGMTDAHGQVIGLLFERDGTRLAVVGGVFGRRVSLRISLPHGGAIEVAGVGQLQRVPGGLSDGLSLVGSGRLDGPGKSDAGTWVTVKPGVVSGP
jgi:hypothetical protein